MAYKLNRNARALARMGASKGGKARASVLTREQRQEIARKAIRTRWAKAKGIPIEEVVVVPYTDAPTDDETFPDIFFGFRLHVD